MPQFRKKPVVIEALQFDMPYDWLGEPWRSFLHPTDAGKVYQVSETRLAIETLEGKMFAEKGDWIIRGVKGELYPCKPDIFAATYEPVSE